MKKDSLQIRRTIAFMILIAFILPTVINVVAAILFPVDYSGTVPVYSDGMLLGGELAEAFLIAALTLMGLKLADDREVIPAAGFTTAAIAAGLVMVTTYERIGGLHSVESMEKTYQMYSGSNFLFAIAVLMISMYTGFPKWLHYLTIFSGVSFLFASVLFLSGNRNWKLLELITVMAFLLSSFVQIMWGVVVWKKRNV